MFSSINFSICVHNHIFNYEFMNCCNQQFHCLIIRLVIFYRQHNIKSIGIFSIEVMTVIKFSCMCRFVTRRSNKYSCFHWNIFSMHNCNMIISAVTFFGCFWSKISFRATSHSSRVIGWPVMLE